MDISSLASLIIAMPIGAIIHQFSVTIKNQIFGLCEDSYLSDSPMKNPTRAILRGFRNSNGGEYVKYIDEKISKLNSFYYMRFDNGFLAPLLAYFLFLTVNEMVSVKYYFNALVMMLIILIIVFILNYFRWLCRKVCCCICVMLIIGSLIGLRCIFYMDDIFPKFVKESNVELTTKSVKVEPNTRYVVTKDYSFESTDSMEPVYTKYIESNLILNQNSALKESYLIESNLQKISIIESKENLANKTTFTCVSKCAKCSNELSCTISNTSENKEESQLHISNAEITKTDTTLLNKILIACLIISFLLLSYIPRIIQEIEEYTNELLQDKKINIQLIPRLKRK